MDELQSVAIVAIIFGVIYKIFELYLGRKERILMIEKLGAGNLPDELPKKVWNESSSSFKVLRAACLLLGIGAGLLTGYLIIACSLPNYFSNDVDYIIRETGSVIYGASVLIGGGLGLLVAYLIEMSKRKNNLSC